MSEPSTEELMSRIRKWQTSGRFHPLTCGNNSEHAVLEPVYEKGEIILVCPDCTYVQNFAAGGLTPIFMNDNFNLLF